MVSEACPNTMTSLSQFSLKEIGQVMEIDPDTLAADAMQEQGIVGSDASVQAPRPVSRHQGKAAPAVDQPTARPRTESQAALRKPGSAAKSSTGLHHDPEKKSSIERTATVMGIPFF